MRLAPAYPLLLTRRGCPLAFDVVDADAPRPQPIIGRATNTRSELTASKNAYKRHWYEVKLIVNGKTYTAQICIDVAQYLTKS